jgi:hypothetical protein
VTRSGRTYSALVGTVGYVCLGMWRSPSSRPSWRMPDTYRTTGIRPETATSSSTKLGTTSRTRSRMRP